MTELWRRDAVDLAAAIRAGEVSSRDVVEAHLARIAALDPGLHALVQVDGDGALAAADAADRRRQAGEPLGALHGVPFTVKDNQDVAGMATRSGVASLTQAVAPRDGPLVARMRAAGAVLLGRSSMPELGLRWHTENGIVGHTVNPWHAGLTPGGSSGGEAVALATGMSPIGIGTDLGGSLRWPSVCCGTAALRPTLGRLPRAWLTAPADPPISTQLMLMGGPMARRVRDLQAVLPLLAGRHADDPWTAPPPAASERVGAAQPAGVGLVTEGWSTPVHETVLTAMHRSARALEHAGYRVETVHMTLLEEAAAVWRTLVTSDLRRSWPRVASRVSPGTRAFVETGLDTWAECDLAGYAEALSMRHGIARQWAAQLEATPLLLLPVSTEPPFPVGSDLGSPAAADHVLHVMTACLAVSALGLPAVAVCVGVERGLPAGVQIVACWFDEERALAAASAVEAAQPAPLTPIDPA